MRLPALLSVPRDEVVQWLADHGAVAANVAQATIDIGPDLGVMVDITAYALRDGQKFFDPATGDAAKFTYAVPLRRLPEIVPVASGAEP